MSVEFWSAAQVYASQESRAITNLRRQGFEAFYPAFIRDENRTRTNPTTPLFPGYVFVRLDTCTRWGSINNTFGVIRLLADRQAQPQRVPLEFMISIKRCILPDPDAIYAILEPGSEVCIRRGPFAEHTAVVEWTRENRLGLFFQIFKQDVRIEVNPADVMVV